MAYAPGIVVVLAGIAVLIATFVAARRHPEWSWRTGPARWLGTLGCALALAGVVDLLVVR